VLSLSLSGEFLKGELVRGEFVIGEFVRGEFEALLLSKCTTNDLSIILLKLSLFKSDNSPENSSTMIGHVEFGLKIIVDSIDVGESFCEKI
jgi:hypothetical protein